MASANKTKIVAKSGRQDIIITREFDAPAEKVFHTHITPDLYSRWLAPRKFVINIQTFEPKAGGSWRYILKDMDGHEMGFHGVYHEVKTNEKIVCTFEFEGEHGYTVLSVTKFEQLPQNRSRLIIQSVFQTVEERDAEMKFLTEEELNDSFIRLEQLLPKA